MNIERASAPAVFSEPQLNEARDKYREAVRGLEGDELKDRLFNEYLRDGVSRQFFEHAEDYDFTEEEIEEMQLALGALPTEEALAALSLPHELRERWLAETHAEIESGAATPTTAINALATLGTENGFGVGFHTSPVDIRPDNEGKWMIKGTEEDHRDNDLPMAYYSRQYKHIFKEKNPRFVYAIRAFADDRTDGNWYRAPSLSVVARLPFKDVYEFVEKEARDIERERAQQQEEDLR